MGVLATGREERMPRLPLGGPDWLAVALCKCVDRRLVTGGPVFFRTGTFVHLLRIMLAGGII